MFGCRLRALPGWFGLVHVISLLGCGVWGVGAVVSHRTSLPSCTEKPRGVDFFFPLLLLLVVGERKRERERNGIIACVQKTRNDDDEIPPPPVRQQRNHDKRPTDLQISSRFFSLPTVPVEHRPRAVAGVVNDVIIFDLDAVGIALLRRVRHDALL